MENLLQFISAEQMIILVTCYAIGVVIKNSNLIKDHFIPFIIMIFAIICNIAKFGFSVDVFLQGIIISFVAVGFNSTLRQLEKEKQK